MDNVAELLYELDNIHGVSGDEERVANYIVDIMSKYVDEHFEDALGNQFFVRKGNSPEYSIMIAAHMDEIGYIVKYIDDKGFISFLPVGIHDPRMSVNQVMEIKTDVGVVTGVVGSKPSHIVSSEEAIKTIPFDELFIDVGTFSKEETENLGIAVGDFITISRKGQFINNGTVYTGKSIDNRSGCAVLIQLMKELEGKVIAPTIYAVTTIQEEIGIRGSGPVAFGIQPDIAIALDVTFAGGTPGIDEKSMPIKLGQGPAIKYFDWSMKTFNGNAVPKKLTKKMIGVAEQESLPYQKEIMIGGATDASKISLAGKGILTGGLSIPMRYMHSSIGTVLMKDIKDTVSLLKAFVMTNHLDLLNLRK
ncbi:M42 family metallopeptidase [Virgibacillus sp. CBA3643]|uniref:M42 family metallopeptidase n=1 Tax=Virgibacillus sp. CBA3643 TaxID=2942278 RepID=UPI0035A37AA2